MPSSNRSCWLTAATIPVVGGQRGELACRLRVIREGLLSKDVLARRDGGTEDRRLFRHRHRDVDDLHPVVGEQLVQTGVDLRDPVPGSDVPRAVQVDIRDPDDLEPRQPVGHAGVDRRRYRRHRRSRWVACMPPGSPGGSSRRPLAKQIDHDGSLARRRVTVLHRLQVLAVENDLLIVGPEDFVRHGEEPHLARISAPCAEACASCRWCRR